MAQTKLKQIIGFQSHFGWCLLRAIVDFLDHMRIYEQGIQLYVDYIVVAFLFSGNINCDKMPNWIELGYLQ
jgi:hypothetical protein